MPDDRNWLASIREPCPECGFDAAAIPTEALAGAVRSLGEAWRTGFVLGAPSVTVRPDVTTWSALEYACHTRDVLAIFASRVALTLAKDDPDLGWWDHEAAATDESYDEQDPGAVLAELGRNAEHLAGTLDRVPVDGWQRAGIRRRTERFTVADMARFSLHEGHHHLRDARTSASLAI